MPKMKILITEDESIVAMHLESKLQKLRYEVTSIVDSGEATIKSVIANQPDLVLMDIRIKGEMDGIDTAHILKNRFNIPVIFLTAHTDKKTIIRAKMAEPYGYLLKPFEEKELSSAIEIACYKHKTEQELKENREALKRSNKELEDRVRERTLELYVANEQLKNEQHKRLSAIIDGQEIERRRLSRELHDGLGSLLTAVKLNVGKLNKSANLTESSKATLNDIKALMDNTITAVRKISYDLMPSVLIDFGVNAAIKKLASQLDNSSNTNVTFHTRGVTKRLQQDIEIGLFRIAQEAVNNAIKHSNAQEIRIRLIQRNDLLKLVVKDNGKGFNVKKLFNNSKSTSGNGLHNMHERAALLNGKLIIDSVGHKGTLITLEISNILEKQKHG